MSHPGALSPGGDVVVVGLADRGEPSLLLRVLGQQGGHQLPLQDPKRGHYLYWREREREIIDRLVQLYNLLQNKFHEKR